MLAGRASSSNVWGLDLLAFLPPTLRGVIIVLVICGLGLVAWGTSRKAIGHGQRGTSPPRLRAYWAALPGLALVCWLLRDRSHLLGDGLVWIDNIMAGQRPLYSEPLAAVTWYGFAAVPGLIGSQLTPTWLSVLPVLAGIAAAPLMWGLFGTLAKGFPARLLAMLLLLTTGVTQLYCGYIESYPIVSVAILLYVFVLMKHLDGSVPDFVVAIALSLALSCHFVTLYLVPSYLLLLVRNRPPIWRGTLLVVLPFALAGAILTTLGYRFSGTLEPVGFVLRAAAGHSGYVSGSALRILPHARDFLNLCLLLFPIPALVVIALGPGMTNEITSPRQKVGFLLSAATPGLVAAIVLGSTVSPAHDWDLLTVCLLPLTVLLAALGGALLATTTLPVRTGVMALASASLLAFVLVNASEKAAVRRYDSLLADDMLLTPHERAYGNERLVKVYTRWGDPTTSLHYAERALAADSANARYWGNVGTCLYNLKRYEESLGYFVEAARRDSTRADATYHISEALMHLGRFREAVLPLRQTIATGGESARYLFPLGLALVESGEIEDGRRVWERLLLRWPEDDRTREAYAHYFGGSTVGH